jgi:hypothetical protein
MRITSSIVHGTALDATVSVTTTAKSPASVPGDRKYGHVMKCEDQRSGAAPASVHFGTLEPP